MSIKKSILVFTLLLITTVLVVGGLWFYTDKKDTKLVKKFQEQIAEKKDQLKDSMNKKEKKESKIFLYSHLARPVFAAYQSTPVTIKSNLSGDIVDLEEVENLDSFSDDGINFNEEQLQKLKEYNFFLAQNDIIDKQEWGVDDFVDMYDKFDGSSAKAFREQHNSVFVTSDVALHLYHKLISKTFQKIEEKKFQPMLTAMTRELFKDSIENYKKTTDKKMRNSYKRLSAYYLVPLVILDLGSKSSDVDIDPEDYDTFAKYLDAVDAKKIENSLSKFEFSLDGRKYNNIKLDEEIYELAQEEINLINNSKGVLRSPLFSPLRPKFKNDYSQFKPRSHYTKNNVLKSYFIAMMWYGRMGFTLNSSELTRDALIITGQINNLKTKDEDISKMWSDMSAVIGFFVGNIDDLTPYHYTELVKDIYGKEVSSDELVNGKLLNTFISSAVKELPKPKIISEVLEIYDDIDEREEALKDLMQFRFFGQRFTPDAYMLNKLTQGVGAPDSETGQNLPTMPTALMPISLLNSDNKVIKSHLDSWVNKNASDSDQVIEKYYNELDAEFSAYKDIAWSQNIYWSWLNCFKPLLSDYQDDYPFFMTNEKWQEKNLSTVLGSYTELKHDTLLYAKQSYAEMGAGGPGRDVPAVVKGYVEPDLTFWSRLIDLAEMTQSGLNDKNIFPQEYKSKFEAFLEASKFLKQIATSQLKNEEISDEDFEKLRTISVKFKFIASALAGEELSQKDKRAGIIADIHTDAVNSEILYEATGKPYILYVIVKDINGARLTRGAVFNHYEFVNPLDERLSDEDWQELVYDKKGEMPEKEEWNDLVE